MSGKLVGEVLAAQAKLKDRGITERGFMALIAIAEKCHPESRQGSVRWAHIRAGLYGSSKRTAERAVAELKAAGIIRVVSIGWTNQHTGRAPIYEIDRIDTELDTDTTVSTSKKADTDTALSPSTGLDTDKIGVGYRQNGVGYRHSSVVLDGSIDGFLDGGAPADPPPPPSPRCPKHRNAAGWVSENCGPCAQAKKDYDAHTALVADAQRRARAARRAAIDDCGLCDDNGKREISDDTVITCGHNNSYDRSGT